MKINIEWIEDVKEKLEYIWEVWGIDGNFYLFEYLFFILIL